MNPRRLDHTGTYVEIPVILQLLEELAFATPNPCEGSRGDTRETFAYECINDYVRAESPAVRSLYAEGARAPDKIRAASVQDAFSAYHRWMREDYDTP